jgi:hypothetical protein
MIYAKYFAREFRLYYMLLEFIYIYRFQIRFPYHKMFVSFSINTTGATNEAGNIHPSGASEFTTVFCKVRDGQ